MMVWLGYWVFLGVALCALLAPGLLGREGSGWHWLAASLSALGVIQLNLLLELNGAHSDPVWHLHHMALYMVAPLFYLGVKGLLGEVVPAGRAALHLLPGALLGVFSLLEAGNDWQLPGMRFQQLVHVLCFGVGAVYVFLILRRFGQLARPASVVRIEASLLALAVVVGLGVAILALLGGLLDQTVFYQLYGSAITLLLLLAWFLNQQRPQLAETVAEAMAEAVAETVTEASPARRRSLLLNVDVEAMASRLRQVMEDEHLYRRDDLDLAGLAATVGLTSHQLSELLNERLGLGFSRYLKQYRVAEAKELLLSRPALSVLEVGLMVGFSSLSAFYSAFRELEGMAPGKYRQQRRLRPADL